MKKILLVQDALNTGGAEKLLIDILNGLDYSKYSIDLLLLYKQGEYLSQVNSNVNLKYIFPEIKYNNKIYKKIYYMLAKIVFRPMFIKILSFLYIKDDYDYQVGFIEGYSTAIVASSAKKSKKIAWVQSHLNVYKPLSENYQNNVYKKIDKIIAISNGVKKTIIDVVDDDNIKNKIKVIYNFVDREKIEELSKIPINCNEKYILAVGRLEKVKRFDLLIMEFYKTAKKYLDVNLLILGQGSEYSNYKNLIISLGMEKRIKLLGFNDNPYPYIKKSEALIISSISEGLSLVCIEATMLKTSIITTICGGPEEIIEYGKCGYIVNGNNISEQLEKIFTNSKEREKKIELAYLNSKKFDKDTYIKNIDLLFSGK